MSSPNKLRTSFLSFSALLLCIQPVRSQETACTVRKLPVYLRDAQNLPLQNVSVTDLEAKLHGKPVQMLSLAPDPRPRRLVLILDTSGSMGKLEGDPALWNLELSLALHFFETNRQKARIAVLFFGDEVHDVIDFAQGNAAVGEKLRQVTEDRKYVKTIKGRTALRDAIFQGIQLLDHPSSADAVYVLTDGGDNASHHSASELDRRLAVASVRLFAVLLYQERSNRGRTPEELTGPGELAEITQKSGGEILTAARRNGNGVALSANADSKVNSEETLRRLYQTILEDSLLEVELPFAISKNEYWEIKLSSAARRRWKNVKITYPDTLVSCDAEVSGLGRN
jgi:von Willebrand factor type A domain